MGTPSKVLTKLPPETLSELNKKLVAGHFSDYEGLAEWLREAGYDISKSSVARYGKTFKERVQAIKVASDQAKDMIDELGDDTGAFNESIIKLLQEHVFSSLISGNLKPEDIKRLSRLTVDLCKASNTQQKIRQDLLKSQKESLMDGVASGTIEKDAADKAMALLGLGGDE